MGEEQTDPSSKQRPRGVERHAHVDDVRRRLESGELDSDMAALDTAAALLDGDAPLIED